MSGTDEIKLEKTVEEPTTQQSADSVESSSDLRSDPNSDNSQSSVGAPPDITQADSYSLDDPYTSDPPDLNPEEDTEKTVHKEENLLPLTYEAAELSDSSGPPDITHCTNFEKVEEEELEIKEPDYDNYADDNSPAPLLTSLEDQGEFTDFPTDLPEDPQHIFTETDPPPDLLHQEDLTPSEGYLASSFPESSLSESLLAVAPGDILPVVSLPQANPQFLQQAKNPHLPQNIKRGPGRPRKDGLDPLPRRRTNKTVAKSIVTKAQRILHNSSAITKKYYPGMDSPSGQLPDLPIAGMEGEVSQYDMMPQDEDVSTRMSENSDETSLDSQLPVRICSFCNCGERSLLGQGDLCRYEPTPGFNFRKSLTKNTKNPQDFDDRASEREGTTKPLTWRRNRGPIKGISGEFMREKSHSPRRSGNEEDPNYMLGEELAILGFPEETEPSHVFEPTGHVWAHFRCAAWSSSVSSTLDNILRSVDKAVCIGLSEKCSYCRRYGATINCIYRDCVKKYHYPCAAAGSCFQDKKKVSILCPDHSEHAEAIAGEESLCVLCGKADKISKQLFCTSCGHHYHGSCLHPSVAMSPEVRAGWQCPDCKVCQMCRQPGEDSKMLVCDTCDKGYHTFCLKPVMTTIPKNGWKCKNCRVCGDCGSRTPGSGPSSRWHLNYSVCDSCYQQRNKGLSCPLCGKAYRQFTQKAMIQCNTCKKHVHAECDEVIDNIILERVKNEEHVDYMCSVCRNRDPEMDLGFPFGMPSHGEEPVSEMYDLKDSDFENGSSIMDESSSSFLLNEDSISSMDIDISALEKGVQQLSSPPHHHPHGEGYGIGSKGGKLNAMSRKKMGVTSTGRPRGRPVAPEKKKRPPAFCERKRGPKPKLKTSQLGQPSQMSPALIGESKKSHISADDDDGEDDHPHTLILANALDRFVLEQDVCKSCGSFGQGEEGKLIVCTQCGQCYHPYCASVKVTKVILQKGWRCLDCTVCEGCGKPHDEGRLLLCDECDISYHTYCLDPPLDHVPKGTWKCKWCVMCINCGATSPGFGCHWQNNYTQCGPCRSKIDCPVCRQLYHEEEMIIQCNQCDRWLHGLCDGLQSEDDMERASDYGYHCLFCRPKTGKDGPLPPPPPPPTPPRVEIEEPPTPPTFYREPEPQPQKRFLMDGVYLSETGKQHMQEITIQIPKVKRQRRVNKAPSMEMMSGQRLHTQMSIEADDVADNREGLDDMRNDGDILSTPDGEPRSEGDVLLSPTGIAPGVQPGEGEKKERKKRTTIGLGVGGFIAKQRNRAPNVKRQTSEVTTDADGQPRPEVVGEEGEPMVLEEMIKKRKPRQARKKSQLENSFPNYLQEAFFGKDILDKSKAKVKLGHRADSDSDPESRASTPNLPKDIPHPTLFPNMEQSSVKLPSTLPSVGSSQSVLPSGPAAFQKNEDMPMAVLPDLEELPPDDLLSIFNMKEFKDGELDEGEQGGADQTTSTDTGELGSNLAIPDVESGIDLDKMITDDLAQFDGQTVEDIFKGVLQTEPTPNQGPEGTYPPFPVPGSSVPGAMGAPRPPHHPGQFHPGPAHVTGMPPQYYGQDFRSMGGEQPAWQQVCPEEETGGTATSRRNMLKWECDEDLGTNATISAVLYCNLKHPEFKQQYPDWSERVKKIAKAWRELSSEEKQPYLMQARKNRANTKSGSDKVNSKQKRADVSAQKAAVMGPPLPPGPHPPYPPPPGSDGSPVAPGPEMRSPMSRTSGSQLLGTPEGHSPGNLPDSPMGSHPGTPLGSHPGTPLGSHPGTPMGSHPGTPMGSHPGTSQEHRMMAQDPFNPGMVPPGVRHPTDPYGQPATPRPGMVRNSPGDSYNQGPLSTDPYAKPPSTPMSGPHTLQQSPSKLQWPGAAQESEAFDSTTPMSVEGLTSPRMPAPTKPYDPYAHPLTPRSSVGPPAGIHRPPFTRQSSQPGSQSGQVDDPYAFPPHTPRPGVEVPLQHPADISAQHGRHPGEIYSGMGDHIRPPYPPTTMQGHIGQPLKSPGSGPESYGGLAGQTAHPFRPPGPPTSQAMVKPPGGQDLYGQPLHPGVEPQREQSALQQMYAAASRRHALFPFSGMFSTLKHPYLGLQDKVGPGETSQQVREILAQKAKIRINKQGKETPPWDSHPAAYPGDEISRFPVPRGQPVMDRWPGASMVRAPGPRQFSNPAEMEGYTMRGQYGEAARPGLHSSMRQPRPHGPMLPDVYSPTKQPSPQISPGQHPALRPGQNPLAIPEQQRNQFAHMLETRFPHPPSQIPPGQQAMQPVQTMPAHSQAYQAYPPQVTQIDQSRIPHDGIPDQGKLMEPNTIQQHTAQQDLKTADPKEEKKESEDEKQLNEQDIDDLLGSDGTFDIIKFVDTDTLDENKSIFDDLDEVENGTMDGTTKADGAKEELKLDKDKLDSESEAAKASGAITDFQSKFLEFSQKKTDERKPDDPNSDLSEMEKKQEQQNISQIAALLQQQSTEHITRPLERRDSQKSDSSSQPGKDQLPRTPGSGPLTPSGLQPGLEQTGSLPGMGPRPGYGPGMQSPLHQMQSYPTHPSPGSSYPQGQGPSTPGLPSPKVMPSPRSNIPSPRTPSVQSPFNPMGAQTQSPFSPTVSSAPQSPYAPGKTQSPFTLPIGTNQSTFSSADSAGVPPSPGQRSPRGTITPTNQYIQGTYGQPMMQGPQRGTTLTPTPNSILYGQSVATQHGIRNQVPQSGPRPPYSGPPMSQSIDSSATQMQPGMEIGMPRMPISQAPAPGSMETLVHPQGHPPSSMMQTPYGVPNQRMIRPPAGGLPSPVTTSAPGIQTGSRPQLLQDQPLLIQDLLEQEKQEQQRQAQQQAMGMMQRQPPEGMMVNQARPAIPMGKYRPGMERMRLPVDPNWVNQRPYGQPEIPTGQPPFHVRMPGQQMPPRMPGPYSAQTPGMGMGIPPPQQPPPPPMNADMTPELERQHQQYEDWLMKHAQYLEMQVKALEQQISKCKRTKKAINARNRQAKKTGREPSPNDAIELERITQEQSMLQKQLDTLRKQVKQHQMQTQDYRSKKRERYGQDWAFSQMPPAQGPAIMSVSPGGLQPRIPNQQGSARLTASARQMYDEYMQDRLRQSQQISTATPQQRPQHTVVEDSQSKVVAPKAIIQDNNPFSEEYQEREQRERENQPRAMPDTVDKTDMMRQMPPYFDQRGIPYDQAARFPPPRLPADHMQRFQGPPGQRLPFEGAPRKPHDPNMRHPYPPQRMYTPMNQGQIDGAPGPRPQIPFQQGFGSPPSDVVPVLDSAEKKSKKRKKKKKPAESSSAGGTTIPNTEPRPPIQYTPQSETEKRIMEILNNTAGLARAQDNTEKMASKARPSTASPENKPSEEQTGDHPNSGDLSVKSDAQAEVKENNEINIYQGNSESTIQQNTVCDNDDTEDLQEETILPMNVMIHQSVPQRAMIVSQGNLSQETVQPSQSEQNHVGPLTENVPPSTAIVASHKTESNLLQSHTTATNLSVTPSSATESSLHQQKPELTVSSSHSATPGIQGHPNLSGMPPRHAPHVGSYLPGRMSPRGMAPPPYLVSHHQSQFHGRMSPRQAAPFGMPPGMTSQGKSSPRQSSVSSPGSFSPRQASPVSHPSSGHSPGRYSPRQSSPSTPRPPSRPPSQSGHISPRQGPTPPIYDKSNPGHISPRQGPTPQIHERQNPTPPIHDTQGPTPPVNERQGPGQQIHERQGPTPPFHDRQGPTPPINERQGSSTPNYDSQGSTPPIHDCQGPSQLIHDRQCPTLPIQDSQGSAPPVYDRQGPAHQIYERRSPFSYSTSHDRSSPRSTSSSMMTVSSSSSVGYPPNTASQIYHMIPHSEASHGSQQVNVSQTLVIAHQNKSSYPIPSSSSKPITTSPNVITQNVYTTESSLSVQHESREMSSCPVDSSTHQHNSPQQDSNIDILPHHDQSTVSASVSHVQPTVLEETKQETSETTEDVPQSSESLSVLQSNS